VRSATSSGRFGRRASSAAPWARSSRAWPYSTRLSPIRESSSTSRPTWATKIAVYRILQEALANGHRHSGASRQRLTVDRRGSAIALTVSDDGKGFDPQRVLASEADVGVEGGHFGLRGIQDRVAMLGGTFAIDSAPGRGTSLTVTLPVE